MILRERQDWDPGVSPSEELGSGLPGSSGVSLSGEAGLGLPGSPPGRAGLGSGCHPPGSIGIGAPRIGCEPSGGARSVGIGFLGSVVSPPGATVSPSGEPGSGGGERVSSPGESRDRGVESGCHPPGRAGIGEGERVSAPRESGIGAAWPQAGAGCHRCSPVTAALAARCVLSVLHLQAQVCPCPAVTPARSSAPAAALFLPREGMGEGIRRVKTTNSGLR